MRRCRLVLSLLVALVLISLVLPVRAQEQGPKPVGLRPDAPKYALHGPFRVGLREFSAKTDFHPTTVAVWYPALNPKEADRIVMTSQGQMVMHALQNAAPDVGAGPYPLVIFIHSLDQQRFATVYLSEHLASQGFVVMAIDYADNAQSPAWKPPKLWPTDLLFSRPRDVSWQIDYAQSLTAADGKLAGMIDATEVAVIGQSFGADTALVVGGARMDATLIL